MNEKTIDDAMKTVRDSGCMTVLPAKVTGVALAPKEEVVKFVDSLKSAAESDLVTSLGLLFAYDGFDPSGCRALFLGIAKSKGRDPVKDAVALIAFFAKRGPSILRKGIAGSQEDAKRPILELISTYGIVEKVPSGENKKEILTVPRIIAAFPHESYLMFNRLSPSFITVPGWLTNLSFGSAASLIPESAESDVIFEAYLNWAVEFDKVVNEKVRAHQGVRFDPIASRRNARRWGLVARKSKIVPEDVRQRLCNSLRVTEKITDELTELYTKAKRRGIEVEDLLEETIRKASSSER